MATTSLSKLESLALIAGPVVALAFFLLEPGAMLIDPADSSGDSEAIVTAMASNQTLAHVSSLVVPLGLAAMVYGLLGLGRFTGGDSGPGSLSRFGLVCMVIGAVGWILGSGLAHVLAETPIEDPEAIQRAISVHQVDYGIGIMSSMAVSLGFTLFSFGLSSRYSSGFGKIAALVVAAISVLALAAFIIGHSAPNDTMISLARACYFIWTAWSVYLGVTFLKGTAFSQGSET